MINGKLVSAIVVMLLLGLSHGLAYRAGQTGERQAWQLQTTMRERDDNAASLAAYQAETVRLHGLSVRLDSRIETLVAIRPKIVERYTHEKTVNPLPAACRLDAERLRIINDAIRTANTAAAGGPDEAVPAASAAGDG